MTNHPVQIIFINHTYSATMNSIYNFELLDDGLTTTLTSFDETTFKIVIINHKIL